MLTLPEISGLLRDTARRNGLTQARLADTSGISARTLTHVLSGQEDFRVSTLMAVAHQLGLELVLVPKAAARAVAAGEALGPPVRSVVTEALDALHARQDARADDKGRP
ncbi:helix-turn-helix domain-containing protein [Mitsuaria sp. 7]|uniref:helix-turn-helix domain-containing protein n=1 Tax=Mitsuaria sp. 7 TaxID=1658665 RepID=UPI000836EEBE|nr:helix-turn-helix domain-containing protein [Mitsuaria sp. 7]